LTWPEECQAEDLETTVLRTLQAGRSPGARKDSSLTCLRHPGKSGGVSEPTISSQGRKQATAEAKNWLPMIRFRQAVNREPRKTLDTLFFDCYQTLPGLSRFSQLRKLLVPLSSYIYPGIALYAGYLHTPETQTSNQRSLVSREARYLCREIVMLALNDAAIPPGERKKLHQALQWLKVTPAVPADIPNTMKEVLAHIDLYLDKADLLAELPQFQPAYFTGDELAGFRQPQILGSQLELEAQLEITLTPLRKREILHFTAKFIQACPLPFLANQAIAVYITLGEVIPWHQHAFIKRLLVVSIQEANVYSCLSL
jgi:hypothetical protein